MEVTRMVSESLIRFMLHQYAYNFERRYGALLEGAYEYIPLGKDGILNLLCCLQEQKLKLEEQTRRQKTLLDPRASRSTRPWLCSFKFVDAGCGPGLIPVLASTLGFKSTGIEYDERLVKQFGKYFPGHKNSIRMIHGDIRKQDYSQWDFIYYYCPMRDTDEQRKFERRVENQMNKGAFLLTALKMDKKIRTDKKFVNINGGEYFTLFQKVKN